MTYRCMKTVLETWPTGAWRRCWKHDLPVQEGDVRKHDLPVQEGRVRNMTYRCKKAVSETWPTGARRRCQVGVGVARRAQPRVLITSLTPAWWRASLRALVSVKTVFATWNKEAFFLHSCGRRSPTNEMTRDKRPQICEWANTGWIHPASVVILSLSSQGDKDYNKSVY